MMTAATVLIVMLLSKWWKDSEQHEVDLNGACYCDQKYECSHPCLNYVRRLLGSM